MHPGLKGFVEPKSPFFFEPPVSIGKADIRPGVQMGMHSYINDGRLESGVYIGRYCSIGNFVSIGTGHHDMSLMSTSSWFTSGVKPSVKKTKDGCLVRILNDVWIGDKAIIMNGVTVGNGAIIGAGAVVTKDVDHYSIVTGIPAKHLKYRFSPEIVARLMKTRWWELDDQLLKTHVLTDIESSLEFLESISHTARTVQPKTIKV